MKLIIDIDDKRIKGIKLLAKEQDIETTYPTLEQIISNGIPLDKIRSEINDIEEGISSYYNDRPWIFKDEVLQIIDRYRNEKQERSDE